MKHLRVVVPGSLASHFSDLELEELRRLGLEEDWLMFWVLYNWLRFEVGKHTLHDCLYEDLWESYLQDDHELLINDPSAQGLARIDELIAMGQRLHDDLRPFLGNLPVGTKDRDVYGLYHQPLGEDLVITIEYDAA